MNETEIDIVAEELAKLGGTSWYPGRGSGPVMRVVSERYRDRARAAIAALDRFRARKAGTSLPLESGALSRQVENAAVAASPAPTEDIKPGTRIVYRPPGDRRAYPCIVRTVRDGYAYLVPEDRTGISWVSIAELEGARLQEKPQPVRENP